MRLTLQNDPTNLSLCKQVGFDNEYTPRRDPAAGPRRVETREGRRVLFQLPRSHCGREAQGWDPANLYWHY